VQPEDGINWLREILIAHGVVIIVRVSKHDPMSAEDNKGSCQHLAHRWQGNLPEMGGPYVSRRALNNILATTEHLVSDPGTQSLSTP
jgi:hypothetical protein